MVWGHARHCAYGFDIVCAAVSAVATTALLGLVRYTHGKVLFKVLPQGFVHCRLPGDLTGDEAADAAVILETMVDGLDSIRDIYKSRIDIAYI